MATPRDYNRMQADKGLLTEDQEDFLIEEGARSLQQRRGLHVDGKAGPKTRAAIEAESSSPLPSVVPVPKGRSAVKRVYGDFDYEDAIKPSGAKSGRIMIDDGWVATNIVTVRLHTGKRVRLHRLIAEEFRELFKKACEVSGYTPKSVQTFVPRHIRWDARRKLSYHSWGIAVDFDPKLNPAKSKDTVIRKHMEFVDVFRNAGWTWGGDWKSFIDDMHFQRSK